MTFCPNCGSNVESNLKFCSQCGTKLEDDQPQPQAVYVQPQPQPTYAPPQPTYTAQPAYAPQPTYPSYGTRPYGARGGSSYGIGACVCGVLSLFIPFVGLFLAIVAIALGAMGNQRDDTTGPATAGIVLGVLGLICGIVWFVMLMTIFMYMPSPFYYY